MNIGASILDFFFSNIAFVILIVGGIYSFLKRLNDSNKNTQNTHRRSDRPVFEQKKQSVSPLAQPTGEVAKVNETVQPIKEELSNKDPHRIDRKYREIRSNRYQDKEDQIVTKSFIDTDDLPKAVIWSEILSKPKAYKNDFKPR